MDDANTPTAQLFNMTMGFNDVVSDVERHVAKVKDSDLDDARMIVDTLEMAVGALQAAKRIMATLTEFCALKDDAIFEMAKAMEEDDENVSDLP